MIKAAIYGRVGKNGGWIITQSGIEMACKTLAVNDATNTEGEAVVVFNILCHSFKLNAKALRSDLCPNPLTLIKPLKICSLVKT